MTKTFARQSQSAKTAAQRNFNSFCHVESETAAETIKRFDGLVHTCLEQGIVLTQDDQQLTVLDQCNERYDKTRHAWENASFLDKKDLDELKEAMHNDDERFKRLNKSYGGSVARAEGKSMDDIINERIASAEILWAQKYSGSSSSTSTGRPATGSTVCYSCAKLGHYSRDCPNQGSLKCTFCNRTGHVVSVCRQRTKPAEEAGAATDNSRIPRGEVFFFHDQPAECNVITFGRSTDSMQTLEYISSIETAELQTSALCNSARTTTVTGASSSVTHSGLQWLCDTGASHHVCNDKSRFKTLQKFDVPLTMETIGSLSVVTHFGSIDLSVDGDGAKRIMTLDNVILVETSPF